MPFDGTSFDPPRPGRKRPVPSDNGATVIILVVVFVLLIVPTSLTALADIIRYASR